MNPQQFQAWTELDLTLHLSVNAVWIVVGVMWCFAIPIALARFWWYTSFARRGDE